MSNIPPPPPVSYPAPQAHANTAASLTNPSGIGKALWISLLIFAVIQALSGLAHLNRAWVLHRLIQRDLPFDSSSITTADTAVDSLNAVKPFVTLTVFVCLVIWLFKITKFSRSEGAQFKRGDGWAIGGFFIPIGNLFIPFSFARDNFLHFINKGRIDEDNVSELKFWWIGYIGCFFANNILESNDPTSLPSLRAYDLWAAGLSILVAAVTVSGVLAIRAISSQTPTATEP